MAYLNLLYRQRADLSGSAAEYQRDVALADSWVQRALETKRSRADRQSAAEMPRPQAPGLTGRIVAAPPPPPPPSAGFSAQPAVPGQIRISGNVQAAKLIEQSEPEYPALASQARIQGTVRLHAIVLKDGTVGNLTLVSGHPLLVPSAQDAVRKYRYQPNLVNGATVEVATEIDVRFVLP